MLLLYFLEFLWNIKEALILFILTEIATREKNQISEKIFPLFGGYIPYKYKIIGKAIDLTNESIKVLLSTEPPKNFFKARWMHWFLPL